MLLKKFIIYQSKNRITATMVLKINKALLDPYFFNHPLPAHHLELPIPEKFCKEKFDTDEPLDFDLFFSN
jgi:cell cycle related kinase